jgi:hypothetical protein
MPLVAKHPVGAYYVVAFVISWGAILLVVGPGGFFGRTAPSSSFALVGFASLLGPSLAGVVLTRRRPGSWLARRGREPIDRPTMPRRPSAGTDVPDLW